MDRGIEWKSCEISRFEIGGAYPPHLRGVYLRGIWLQQNFFSLKKRNEKWNGFRGLKIDF